MNSGLVEAPAPGGGTLLDHVHGQLRQAILDCRLAPGEPLSQVRLAAEFKISRTPLREVLRLLEREGLVQSQHNYRFRVSGFSLDDLVQVHASRIMLETLAVRQSVRSMSPMGVEMLESTYVGMQDSAGRADYDEWHLWHRAFHRTLNERGGSRLLESIDRLTDLVDRYRRIYQTSAPLAWGSGLRQHARILDAVRGFDVEGAAREVARHLSAAALTTVRAVDATHDTGLIEQAMTLCQVELAEDASCRH